MRNELSKDLVQSNLDFHAPCVVRKKLLTDSVNVVCWIVYAPHVRAGDNGDDDFR